MTRIFSIGHSTRPLAELIEMLQAHSVLQLVDVRAFPGSRRHPHFARSSLAATLPAAGIAYLWLPALGGRRQPGQGRSANTAWREAAFRAYADHMGTAEFATARDELEERARALPTAFMCAEAYYRRCHRQLLADALVARGWEVLHIESMTRAPVHALAPFARVDAGGQVTYPGDPPLPLASA
ncbi:MAG TPA: DUF488 domain-containing protein [Candidatus Krumholzibacteria bacterium]|nr:DUF488 domain-containing protein [Candidatus Krumholzibacteria bacterium]